ncbi:MULTISPECIES: MaoC family dehydratase [Bordetella]|uniref:Enoyl-CoA hydratase n=2 Tax=Bordetella TaxID=517 RepID=A0A261VRG1_9BORD|nr:MULTISPECIES: MaoC family dehydratase [Bordetella]MDM9561696.1 MaoC family dehydratase [Bordetella petrii]OZI76639.1 enoyl-CoA hydratase [Bordetella genomosp. 2]
MLTLDTPYDLEAHVGKILGRTDWVEITQEMIDDFARISGDRNWIHVDVARARRELPDGKTIAHGMLTFSLMSGMGGEIVQVRERGRGINYGSNKVRFTAPVQVGARIRLERSLVAFERMEGGVRLTYGNTMYREGQERPVMVAETLNLMYEKGK